MSALRSTCWLALVLAACPGPAPEATKPDAMLVAQDASAGGPDAAPATDGAAMGPADAEVPRDAGESTDARAEVPDAAVAPTDAGPATAVAQVGSEDDALASYLMNASPPEWNIFSGASVPLGRHFDSSHVSYYTALRFAAVQVPPGATIAHARLTFFPSNSVDSAHNLWLNVYAEKADDSAAFDPSNYLSGRPDQRARTTASIDHWLVRCNDSCTDLTEYDCPQRKLDCWDQATAFTCPKDLKALVQEVVDQPGWAAGHAMTILLINSATDQDGAKYQDSRTIVGYDMTLGASYAPRLEIELAP
jgi:hypothetical protein